MLKEIMKEYSPEMQKQFKQWYGMVSKKVEIQDVSGPAKSWPDKYDELPKFPVGLWPPTDAQLKEITENLVKLAFDLGAADAKIISTKDIPQDIRSLYVSCLYPRCRWLNTNVFCPLKLTRQFEEMVEYSHDFKNALVFKAVPPEFGSMVPDVGKIDLDPYYVLGGAPPPDKAMLSRNIIRLRMLDEMTRRLRQVAFYSGCIESFYPGNGPCIVSKCSAKKACSALATGGICGVRDRMANGAVLYIDYYQLGQNLGWGQLQPGGNCSFPEDTPKPKEYYNIGILFLD